MSNFERQKSYKLDLIYCIADYRFKKVREKMLTQIKQRDLRHNYPPLEIWLLNIYHNTPIIKPWKCLRRAMGFWEVYINLAGKKSNVSIKFENCQGPLRTSSPVSFFIDEGIFFLRYFVTELRLETNFSFFSIQDSYNYITTTWIPFSVWDTTVNFDKLGRSKKGNNI